MKFAFLLMMLFSTHLFSQTWKAARGEVTFYSYAPLEDIKATSKQVNSFITFDKKEIIFIIPMRSFHFQKSLMEEHFNEKYVESDKFPQATYKGKINEQVDPEVPGKYNLTGSGKLSIHGVENEINETAILEVGKDTITLETSFNIAIAAYNITKPQLLFQNIADTVEVKMKAWYVPYKKVK